MSAIEERIRKLLALADSPNENEAAAAAEKAQALMLRYGIEMATIAALRGRSGWPSTSTSLTSGRGGHERPPVVARGAVPDLWRAGRVALSDQPLRRQAVRVLHGARGWRHRSCPSCKAQPGELCRTPTGGQAAGRTRRG